MTFWIQPIAIRRLIEQSIGQKVKNKPKMRYLLGARVHNRQLLPVIRSDIHGPPAAEKTPRKGLLNVEVVQEFRQKLKMAEDLVAKLSFNLREIQTMWTQPSSGATPSSAGVSENMDPSGSRVVKLFSHSATGFDRH